MALEFDVISLKWDEEDRVYYAEIKFKGKIERYEIYCNAATKIRGNSPLMITVDDCIPEKEDDLQIRVEGVLAGGKMLERELNEAIIEYAFKQ